MHMLSPTFKSAIDVLCSIARSESEGPKKVKLICEETALSVSYIEKLVVELKAAKLVDGVIGPGGGYQLTRPAEGITIGDICKAVGIEKQIINLDVTIKDLCS